MRNKTAVKAAKKRSARAKKMQERAQKNSLHQELLANQELLAGLLEDLLAAGRKALTKEMRLVSVTPSETMTASAKAGLAPSAG